MVKLFILESRDPRAGLHEEGTMRRRGSRDRGSGKKCKTGKNIVVQSGLSYFGKATDINKIAGTNSGETLRAQIEGALNCGL